MAEQNKTQMGDGADNYGQAAGQMAKAAKQLGQKAAKQAAAKGVEATANAATAAVQASVQGGKAAAEIAAGTAAGGPWGAILSAAWAMRHTLFKILICICLCLLFLIILVVSLPTIVTNSIFGLDGSEVDPNATLASSYENLSTVVSDIIDAGYDQSLAKVEKIIADGGYDYDLSMEALINHAQSSAGFDVAYILAAYSTSMNQQNTSEADMKAKLEAYGGEMFPVTSQELTKEILIPVSYFTYREVSVTVVTKRYRRERSTEYRSIGMRQKTEPTIFRTRRKVRRSVLPCRIMRKLRLRLLFIQAMRLRVQRARPIIGKMVKLRFPLQQKQLPMWNARSIRLILPL